MPTAAFIPGLHGAIFGLRFDIGRRFKPAFWAGSALTGVIQDAPVLLGRLRNTAVLPQYGSVERAKFVPLRHRGRPFVAPNVGNFGALLVSIFVFVIMK